MPSSASRPIEELFPVIADALPAVVAYIDADERYVYANRVYRERYSRGSELIGRTIREVVGETQYEQLSPHLRRVFAGETVSFEVRAALSESDSRWMRATYVPDVGPDGKVRGFSALSEDVTDRHSAEDAREKLVEQLSRARVRALRLQNITAALSRAQTVADVAESACRVGAQAVDAVSGTVRLLEPSGALRIAGTWGVPPELVDQYRVLPAGDRRFPTIAVAYTRAPIFLETEEDWMRAFPEAGALAKGRWRLMSYAALPVLLDGVAIGVIDFTHPLGHRYDEHDRVFYAAVAQHCQQALERARLLDEARAASRAKDEFFAMLGHELRNPLAPIVTALDLIKARGSVGFERERAIIERQIHHVGRLVDDLLDVARITAGRIQLEREVIALDELVMRAIEMTRPLFDDRQHQLTIEVAPLLFVSADPTRLAQVISNLLANAAKYTQLRGRIHVTGEREGGQVVLRVSDNGVGMTPQLVARVFDLFEQGPQKIDRPQGGLGLGLAIVKSLVGLHGGSVSAKSAGPKQGSEFEVRLPAESVPVKSLGDLRRREAIEGVRTRVLVVDDNQDAAMLLADALDILGFETAVVHDGHAALRAAEEFSPHVAVLDLGLPLLDGYEVGRQLRTRADGPRLIAVTGYGQDSDRRRTLEAGFDAHLVKPVDMTTLQAALDRLLVKNA